MLVDVRYHLASLIGVFLSLGLGILIGTSISSDGRLLKEQDSIIDTIERELGQLRDERTRLKTDLIRTADQLAAYKIYAEKSLPKLVSGRLTGLSVAIVGLSDEKLTRNIQTALQQAGANVTGVAHLGELTLLQGGGLLASTGQLDAGLVRMLVASLQGDAVSGTLGQWDGVQWIQPSAGKAADSVVVVSNEHSTDLLRRVSLALHQGGLNVAATAPGTGWSKALRSAGLPAIEDAALPLGLLSLIDHLAGGE